MAENKILTENMIDESMAEVNDGHMKIEKPVDKKRINYLRTICSPLYLEECGINESGDYSYTIKFLDIQGNEKRATIKRNEFTARNVASLITSKGGYVYNEKLMFDYLKQVESYALGFREPLNETLKVEPIKFVHTYSKAGWYCSDNNEVGFVSSKGCYMNGELQKDSKYVGNLGIAQSGNIKKIQSMIKNSIVDKENIQLQAALAMGCASVLLWYFNNVFNKRILNSIICLSGEKGTGKSTTLELITSLSGKPSPSVKAGITSVYSTFNGTEGALTNLEYNFGYPVAIDDTQHCENKISDAVFYELASGQSKQRLKSNGKHAEKSSEYTTGIFISGEHSIFQNLSESGLKPRIIELSDIKWTYDSNYADSIKNEVYENHGILAPMVAQYVIDARGRGEDKELLASYNRWEKKFLDDAGDKYYVHDTPRFVKTLALFMVAVEVLSKILEQGFQVEEVYKFFFDNVVIKKAKEEQNPAEIYNRLKAYVYENLGFMKGFPSNEALTEDKESDDSQLGDIVEMDDDLFIGEIIHNTPKISARAGKTKFSVFFESSDALYVLEEELGVGDMEAFIDTMLKDKKLISTETYIKKGRKCPRPDCKHGNQRGYRFVLPDDEVTRACEEAVKKNKNK